jgi:hypothetical protein
MLTTEIITKITSTMDGFRIDEFKPRKAAFGFRVIIRGDNVLRVCDILRLELGTEDKTLWFIEIKANGIASHCTLSIYVHDATKAAGLRAVSGKYL